MKEQILALIQSSDTIIVARHKNPDLDAYGSQFGLYYALKNHFSEKTIYVVGDTNPLNQFQPMDVVSKDIKEKALLIILDTVSKQMLDPDVYDTYKSLVLIDHHRNDPDIEYDLAYQDPDASSTAEIVAELLDAWQIPIVYESARALYLGIISDTGRFMYSSTTPKTLRIASELLAKGLDIQEMHSTIYLESKRSKQIKNIYFNKVQYTDKNVAYGKNDAEFLKTYELTSNYASRGLINQMAGIREVPIWANFTEDLETHRIFCEIRSRTIPVLDVAKKYGGGGHLNACGCTLDTWEDTDKVIHDLDQLIEED